MVEEIKTTDLTDEKEIQPPKRGRYGWGIRVTALILVIAILLNFLTGVDFSLMRYKGSDQMTAAQYIMDTTPYLGQSRLQRLKSMLTGVDSFSIYMQAAEIAIGKTEYESAAKFLNKSIPLSPDDQQKAELYNRLGCVYMLAEDPAQALQAFDSSILLDPDMPTPYLLRGQLRCQNGDESGAAQDAGAYLKLGGSDSEMLTTAASICELGGDLEGAVEAMNRIIRMVTDDTEKAGAYAERGRLHYLSGQESHAKEDIDHAKTLDSGVLTGVHYAIIGLIGYDAGDYENSREDFLQAARLSEDGNAEYYEQAILCGYLSENYDFIKETIEEAKGKNLMTASSLLIEGILLFSEERYEEAEAALSDSITTGKIVVGTYYYRGLSRLALGKFDTAAEDFTEAIQWEENKLGCQFNRGVCYFALGQKEKAEEDLKTVADNEIDPALAESARELLRSF